jgi:hypothetical protein
VDVPFHAVQVLCLLAAPILAATPQAGRWWSLMAAAAGAVASFWWLGPYPVPDAASVGAAVAIAAAVPLWRPQTSPLMTAAASGAAAGVSTTMLHGAGAAWLLAVPIAVIPLLLSWTLTGRRPQFAPPLVREDALLLLAGLGVGVAMLPSVFQGWRSAVALNVHEGGSAGLAVPAWTLVVVGGSALLGSGYSAWRRG